MSVRVLTKVWEGSRHSGTELLAMLALADFSDDAGTSYPSVQTLAVKCRVKARNMNYVLNALQDSGELQVGYNQGPRGANLYRIVLGALQCSAGVQPVAGVQCSSGVQPVAGLQSSAPTPALQCAAPLHPVADEPSLNRQEPSLFAAVPAADPKPARKVTWKPTPTKPTAETWAAYARAYAMRYGAEPVRNAKVNAHVVQLVSRLGELEAPMVAAFYLQHNGSYYVSQGHAVAALLKDCEKLRTEWATGRKVTQTAARQADRTQSNLDAFGPLLAEAAARERAA